MEFMSVKDFQIVAITFSPNNLKNKNKKLSPINLRPMLKPARSEELR